MASITTDGPTLLQLNTCGLVNLIIQLEIHLFDSGYLTWINVRKIKYVEVDRLKQRLDVCQNYNNLFPRSRFYIGRV